MNTVACRGNSTGMFATLFVGVLDLVTGHLCYCNAGHEKPIIVTGRTMRYLDVTANLPIGIMDEKEYKTQESEIAPGDMILLYTDGLTEAMNVSEELFGLKRVENAVCGGGKTSCRKNDAEGSGENSSRKNDAEFASPQQLLDTMTHEVSAFVNGAEQSDDLTMLVIKYKG
jgi:serine phosphatase RsbU (regulator of sigma subunit)